MESLLSPELTKIINHSVQLSKKMQHDVLTIEHIFLALLEDPQGENLLKNCGLDTENAKKILSQYLIKHIPITPHSSNSIPHQTPALERVFLNMVNHANSSNQSQINIEDFLIFTLAEEQSYSALLLKSYEIEKTQILEAANFTKEEDQLEQYAKNLNHLAKKGKIDPIIGREKEILRASEVLCKRKKNNVVLIGEPGVGKTAIAEGIALSITQKTCAPSLRKFEIFELDLVGMVAGTKYRGDFEKRLKGVLKTIQKRKNVVLFIDEIHMLVGAGSTGTSNMDAANILKPLLSSGNLRCIGATTFQEYKNSFSRDKALNRRFIPIEVLEPSPETCYEILEKVAPLYEKHHNVTYSKDALKACVDLSNLYITERFLPDKAIDLLDEAGVNLQNKKHKTITKIQIQQSLARFVNIPQNILKSDEKTLLKRLEKTLQSKIFSQEEAIQKITSVIKINKAGLSDPKKPIGSFLFVGASGVGKTALSIELANALGIAFHRIDMSEYMEAHSISKLIGAPSGYVGFEQGGILVDMIRKSPHCVLLLDEIEKAHPDIFHLLLQVMDDARLSDNQGNKADFKNVILIMTSNAGTNENQNMGFNATIKDKQQTAIKNLFTPEFRGRLDAIVHFNSLTIKDYQNITKKYITELNATLKDRALSLSLEPSALVYIANLALDPMLGAREIKKFINNNIKPQLSEILLFEKLKKNTSIKICLEQDAILLKKEEPHDEKNEAPC